MGKKPITFTEKDRKNYEEAADVIPEGSLLHQYLEDQAAKDFQDTPKTYIDPERWMIKEVPESPITEDASSLDSDERTLDANKARMVSDADVPSWDSEEHIWNAARARKISDAYGTRIFKKGLRDIMRYVKTAANSGQYECTVYNDNIASDANIDDIIHNLVGHGYTVKKFEQYGGWYIKISW